MKSQIEEEDIMCLVCQEVPINAHTSSCCGCVLCEDCTIQTLKCSKICPHCRNQNPKFEKNMYLIKLINKFPVACKYECGRISQISDIKNHYQNCPKRNYSCSVCLYQGKKQDFFNHITSRHKDEIMSIFDNYIEQSSTLSNSQEKIDPLSDVKNSNGDISHIGKTPKFYRGKNAGHKCNTCDGMCGPHDGCNCPPCMELDLKYRNLLGKNVLVNAEGKVAFLSNKSFQCGTLNDEWGKCGQFGYRCRYCTSLTSDFPYYKHLLQ
ncbi:seven in absentia family protein (macronuclear) [Tetrahymena thermophila SB210]|uniref:Seven in absentia family protein n=1 Tax=Tetrahymena thermophila (strain SB210) TaxID=312017 RepID=W7XI37_TETTS|nr:seven in absentia family protein [Tetrahymena thermophila SB210]EWS74291.1 seven in absentia family protein [Tetrahymena thermophila SB210]|eukprot:XP_012653179.1 seven in absentia family protein [Tetrahymena thermophila SB210]